MVLWLSQGKLYIGIVCLGLSTRQKLTILRIFDHFWHQIEVNWRQYVCYFNKYSSQTLRDCRNWYKSSWKPLKRGIVAIYTTKIDHFAHFWSFLTLNWRQLTSICVLSQKNTHLAHKQTAAIDKNHYENHWKVVLWLFTRQKLMILRIFDHFLP